ncbi:MAG: hypothetical protein OXE98_03820 [Hyphomicrobiales bacterium]|nr:hypothetical protein [Hyphomicrobiales bacterium]
MSKLVGFVSYSSQLPSIGETIERAVKKFDSVDGIRPFQSWRQNDQFGDSIINPIIKQIEQAQCLVADMTVANANVFYEIGYAFGSRKRVIPIVNNAIEPDKEKIFNSIFFDTILTEYISNSEELYKFLKSIKDPRPYEISQLPDKNVPFYLLSPPVATDSWRDVVSLIRNHNRFKNFDPSEQSRLPVSEAVEKVSSSYGVVIPFLTHEMREAELHNLRASFIAGLAKGMGRVTLMIQNGNGKLPVNFRDYVKHWQNKDQLSRIIRDFAVDVFGETGKSVSLVNENLNPLSKLDLGSTVAEDEINYLNKYYVLTDPFYRALHGNARVVEGRKGSGKTALFFQLRDHLRRDKSKIVLDLMPEGYQLLKLKNKVLSMLDDGTKEHTLVAFWEYLLLLEVCYKIIKNDLNVYGRDPKLIKPFEELYATYGQDNFEQRANFSERLGSLVANISRRLSNSYNTEEKNLHLSDEQITKIIFDKNIRQLKEQVVNYLSFKGGLWLLFDNLDKGWSTKGISNEDTVIIRTLLDASKKLERQIGRKGPECHTIIFIRNDVFKLLSERTSDHGKETRASLDWIKKDLLCEVLQRRFEANYAKNNLSFSDHWNEFCVPRVAGEDSLDHFLNNSLMRPRFLLSLINHCRGFAVNQGNMKIQEEDIINGLSTFSDYLVTDINYELRDVFPEGKDLPYIFIGCTSKLKYSRIVDLIRQYRFKDIDIEKSIELLMWHSILGVQKRDKDVAYIHTESYDIDRLKILMRDNYTEEPIFVIHPAFRPSLGVKDLETLE